MFQISDFYCSSNKAEQVKIMDNNDPRSLLVETKSLQTSKLWATDLPGMAIQ